MVRAYIKPATLHTMMNSWDKVADPITGAGVTRRLSKGRERWMSLVGVAVLSVALAACGNSAEAPVGDSTVAPTASTQPAPVVTDAPEPTETPAPSPSPTPDPEEAESSFSDVNGYWCPSSPSGSEPCIDIQLPVVEYDGADGDPDYVYPFPASADDVVDDPRGLTEADYDTAPDQGECWNAISDGFPSYGGARMIFCPVGAVADDPAIDDPSYWENEDWVLDGGVPDFRGVDRLYISQDESPFPYVRAER